MQKAKSSKANRKRCVWAEGEGLHTSYHDKEWGVPVYDDRLLFELLILEGMQAGLSWSTILKKREGFRLAFANFDAKKIARFDAKKVAVLLNNAEIIRHRLKINAAIKNAKAFLEVKKEWKSFADYIWHFVEHKPIQNNWQHAKQVPVKTIISDRMSKDLKKRGFSFVGSTICYAYMQAVGMVNDHISDCFRYSPVKKLGKKQKT